MPHGPVPLEDEPHEPPAPGDAKGVGQPRGEIVKAVSDAVDKALKDLRSDPHIQSASWDKKHGRFMMFLKGGPKKAIYVPVKLFGRLTREEVVDMDPLADALADAVDSGHVKARPAAEVQPHGR